MSSKENGLVKSSHVECESNTSSPTFISTFSTVIVDGLIELENNNSRSIPKNTTTCILTSTSGLPTTSSSGKENDANFIISSNSTSLDGDTLKQQLHHQEEQSYLQLQSPFQFSPSGDHSSFEGTSLESGSSTTVSFLTEIEIIPSSAKTTSSPDNNYEHQSKLQNERTSLTMESTVDPTISAAPADDGSVGNDAPTGDALIKEQSLKDGESSNVIGTGENVEGDQSKGGSQQEEVGSTATTEDDGDDGGYGEGQGGEEGEEEEDDDTTTLSSEAIVDDIELILMPEMCQDFPSSLNMSPKLVRVTELKVNIDDVFCNDDDDDDDQSGRNDFRSIVDCDDDQDMSRNKYGHDRSRFSYGDEDLSSGSELIDNKKGASGAGESSKSSSSGGSRRRRSTSGRISSGVQTDITAVEEPSALSSHHGFRKKSSGKSSSSARLGVPSGSGKKLNWKSELTLLPSKMKVKQSGFNSFESNDERDQYSPRVAKFTSQDTLNLSSQFLKPSTLYRTRNLSRNLNQFASSESTFMLPMSSEQQLTAESPRFRDRVSSSTSGGIFKGASTSHSYSAYQISSILSGSGGVGGGGGISGGIGYGFGSGGGGTITSARRQPFVSGYSGGGMMPMMSSSSSRNFRSSMPDLNAVNKSYAAIADSHRRRQPSKSIKHHSSSSGFRLQKRSSSDEETSSLIDESERCLRSSIDLLLTDELPSPGGDSCFRSTGFGSSSLAATTSGFYLGRRSASQPILNDQTYPPEMKESLMGDPFLPRRLSDMRCSRWAKVILPNGHVAIVSVKETDEIQDSLTVHTDTGCVINLPFRKVVFAWRSKRK